MEMNLDYYAKTVAFMQTKGFAITKEEDTQTDPSTKQPVFQRQRARCVKSDDCAFVFEALRYTDGALSFYFELLAAGRFKSHSFPLDSWKFHPNRIEFKYQIDPKTGLGLALVLDLSEPSA